MQDIDLKFYGGMDLNVLNVMPSACAHVLQVSSIQRVYKFKYFCMKKILVFIVIVLFSIQMQGQNGKNPIPIPPKVMSNYYMCANNTKTSTHISDNQLILKITHPKWTVERMDTVTTSDLFPEGATMLRTVETRPLTKKWYISMNNCSSTDSTNCLRLSYIYNNKSTRSKSFTLEKGQSHILEFEKQTRPASLSFITADSVSFDNIQKIELEKSPAFTYYKDTIEQVVYIVPNSGHSFYWDKYKPDCNDPIKAPTVIQLQKKLKEKGYDCPVNNVLGMKTKAALIQFQKDNGIPVCGYEPPPGLSPDLKAIEEYLKLKDLNDW